MVGRDAILQKPDLLVKEPAGQPDLYALTIDGSTHPLVFFASKRKAPLRQGLSDYGFARSFNPVAHRTHVQQAGCPLQSYVIPAKAAGGYLFGVDSIPDQSDGICINWITNKVSSILFCSALRMLSKIT